MNLDYIFSLYLYLIGCIVFCFFYKHLLLTIIRLELIVILLIFNIFNIFILIERNIFLMILILTIVVCEGALSLSLIVLIVRFFGNDYINSLIILKW